MKIAISTLGCKINQYDSAVIQSRLDQHSFVPFEDLADCYIINTCTVTDRADWQARQLVRRAKRANPAATIIVTGCYAQVNPAEVSRLPQVDYVVGLNRLDDLLRFVERPRVGDEPAIAVGDVKRVRGVPVLGTRALPGHTRAFLKIQEGCNYSCSYCIIPTARGLSRSVTPRQVLEQVRALAGAGYREVVLTGIHLGGYGQDLIPKTDLTSLVEMIAGSGLVQRLRLSSLDPREVPDRLLDVIAGAEVICDHLHICAQAGDDWILKQMRRNYDTAYYRELLIRVRRRLPDAALGSDIIIGFPGESDERFERSLEFFDSLPLTYFHVFPYSERRGTAASLLADQIPPAVKKVRARRMRDLGARKNRDFCSGFLGRLVRVLVEDRLDKPTGLCCGFSRNYLPVAVAGGVANQEVAVRLARMQDGRLLGDFVGDPATVPPSASQP
jgi:threonylcarbamoyladenosine tRNA methylthiotransferase MtaB